MLEAKELNKFKVTFTETGKEDQVFFLSNGEAVLEHIQNLKDVYSFSKLDAIKIEKLPPLDYFPSKFINLDAKEENLWMGEFTHFNNLTNNQNAPGTLYAKKFIRFMYNTNRFDPENRTPYHYVAHLFIPKIEITSNNENNQEDYLKYLKLIGAVTLKIHVTDSIFNDQGIVHHIVLPIADLYAEAMKFGNEKTNKFFEDVMDIHIKKFADMCNPYLYLKSLKNEE